jgi:Cu/Zn superoxide dismutase
MAAVALCAACGGGSAAAPSPSPSPTVLASPSPSPSPSGLLFKLNPEAGVTATGTITLVATPGTTTIELKITGLQANSSHISHIHLGSCQSRGGIKYALNQVIADGQGMADVRSSLDESYPPSGTTWYVVVHAGPDMQGTNASYLLCGNLF